MSSSPALIQRVEQAFELLTAGLRDLYGLLRSDKRGKSLAGDVSALHNRVVLEERLLRSRLGMTAKQARALPEAPIFVADLALSAQQACDSPAAASRELEEYFGFFKLDGVQEFYRRVRMELTALQRSAGRTLAEVETPGLPRYRSSASATPQIVVAGRVRNALLACPLYFILDSSLTAYRDPVKLGFEAVAAGVRMLQLRLDNLSTREFIDVATRLKQVCSERDCILVVNDRLDVAMLSGADGIHIGADDPTPAEVRQCAPRLLIGVTARKPKAALEAAEAGADYLGCGSVYPSATKPGLPLLSPRGIKRIAQQVGIPIVGIGGITPENAGAVLEAGALGVCSVAPFRQRRSLRNLVGAFRELRQAYPGVTD